MEGNCEKCSERHNDGEVIVEEMSNWKSPVGQFGARAMEIEVPTGKWMHRDCAIMAKQDADQKPGQTALL